MFAAEDTEKGLKVIKELLFFLSAAVFSVISVAKKSFPACPG